MGKLFGTDGVRGVANLPPMDSETVLKLGRALAHVVRRNEGRHRILIGKDTRVSGYMLETALESGIASMGVDVLLLGPLPTPGVAFMTRSMRADAGIMISASHNPFEDNGIKFFGPDGFKLDDAAENEIERLLQPGHLDELRASPELIGKAYRIDDAIGRFTVYLKSCVERQSSFEGLKVVLDTANGAAYKVAPLVFSELGMDIITIGDRPDGRNINKDTGSLHPENLGRVVKENGAFCGVAFDGDADRVVFCDENGDVLDGDYILTLCARDLLKRGELRGDSVVGTSMSNLGLEHSLAEVGLNLLRADVGDRHVLSMMRENNLNLGGEQSGHIIYLDHNTTGDGILSSLMVLSALIEANKPMSWVKSLLTKVPQEIKSLRIKNKIPLESIPEVVAALDKNNKRLEGSGRIVLRYSGTERKVRIMVECSDKAVCDEVVEEFSELFSRHLGIE
jgi:phosphoglucosamine mutase